MTFKNAYNKLDQKVPYVAIVDSNCYSIFKITFDKSCIQKP